MGISAFHRYDLTPHVRRKFTLPLAVLAGVLGCAGVATPTIAGEGSFVTFESGQVRPLALSPDGSRLFVTNTPDNRIEIFGVSEAGLLHQESVPVGMEPVAIAARSNTEIWVVNHLSDSVSIVRVGNGNTPSRVVETLAAGDEPRDIVFANGRAFITTAHRGQSSPIEFRPLASEGRADVWVFDANGRSFVNIVTLFADTPRALAVSPDGNTVYAAGFHTGNKTSIVSRESQQGQIQPPLTNANGDPAPLDIGAIVHFDGTEWLDASGRNLTPLMRMSLPDLDVFAIDATANPPVEIASYASVGTTLFNIAVNPVSGVLYVSNTDALNRVRFEGPGDFGGSTVRGQFLQQRITVIDGGSVEPRHLNKHIDYDSFPGTPAENAASLAQPLEMVVSGDGSTLYVAAFGSSKIGVFDTGELEDDSFVPSESSHIELSGGGPSGLVLDEARDRLYVLTRFDNAISVVDVSAAEEILHTELDHVAMFNPEPASVVDGRRFLYDARFTSSRGDSSCGGCHVFGDTDHLGWDLGNPDGGVLANPNPLRLPLPPGAQLTFHPMKGPMATQTLRGMANNGPMHWRGDRTGGHEPGGNPLDEEAAFKAFNVAFEGLLGRSAPLADAEMQAFTDFALQIVFPPNPIRALNNSLTPAQSRGRNHFFNTLSDGDNTCIDCHVLNPTQGRFGTAGLSVVRLAPDQMSLRQAFKIPHLRNMYTKIGFVGDSRRGPGEPNLGDQIRGFGFSHDGSKDTLITFLEQFTLPDVAARRDVMHFLLGFDSNMAPIVGQQLTLNNSKTFQQVRPRLSLLMQRAAVTAPVPECDLIVKGTISGEQRGWVREASGLFRSDRISEPLLNLVGIFQLSRAPGQELTLTCAPPGSGVRMGVDRDEDGIFDGDELDAGSDPSDPASRPRA